MHPVWNSPFKRQFRELCFLDCSNSAEPNANTLTKNTFKIFQFQQALSFFSIQSLNIFLNIYLSNMNFSWILQTYITFCHSQRKVFVFFLQFFCNRFRQFFTRTSYNIIFRYFFWERICYAEFSSSFSYSLFFLHILINVNFTLLKMILK